MKPLYLSATSKARTGWNCCKTCTKRRTGRSKPKEKRLATRGARARLRSELSKIEIRGHFETAAESEAMERLAEHEAGER